MKTPMKTALTMRRLLVAMALFIALFGATSGCKALKDVLTSDLPSDDIAVSEDLSTLKRWFEFPVEPKSVRRCGEARGGRSRMPGPTDYVTFVWVEFDDKGWAALQPNRSDSVGSVTLPAAIARALLPADVVQAGARNGESVMLSGPSYDAKPYLHGVLDGGEGVRIRDHLLVVASTR